MHRAVVHAVPPIHDAGTAQHPEVGRSQSVQAELLPLPPRGAAEQLVEDVVVPFPAPGVDQPHSLQEVRVDPRPDEPSRLGEGDVDVLPEPARVVVPQSPGVPERLEDGVGLQDLPLDADVAAVPAVAVPAGLVPGGDPAEHGEVAEDDLGGDRLARSGLARDQHRLVRRRRRRAAAEADVLDAPPHGAVGPVGRRVGVRGQPSLVLLLGLGVAPPRPVLPRARRRRRGVPPRVRLALSAVRLHGRVGVQSVHAAEGVDRDEDGSGGRVDRPVAVPQPQRVEDGRLVQVRQRDEVVDAPGGGPARVPVLAVDVAQLDVGVVRGRQRRGVQDHRAGGEGLPVRLGGEPAVGGHGPLPLDRDADAGGRRAGGRAVVVGDRAARPGLGQVLPVGDHGGEPAPPGVGRAQPDSRADLHCRSCSILYAGCWISTRTDLRAPSPWEV